MEQLIERLKDEWTLPRYGIHKGKQTPVKLICQFNDGLKSDAAFLPNMVSDFVMAADGAELFKDFEYGQWGLQIFSFGEIVRENREIREWRDDLLSTDLIVGNFLGDSDLLIVSTDPVNFGKVTICTPIDPRTDWYFLGLDFEKFLEKYAELDGDKYWE